MSTGTPLFSTFSVCGIMIPLHLEKKAFRREAEGQVSRSPWVGE
jgi:hypothetical protein